MEVVATVKLKKRVVGILILCVIVSKFSYGEELKPIILPIVDKSPKCKKGVACNTALALWNTQHDWVRYLALRSYKQN